jgi:hypothetical protein
MKEVPLVQAIGEYEAAMLDYGFEAVKNSIEKPLFGLHKSGAGSLRQLGYNESTKKERKHVTKD